MDSSQVGIFSCSVFGFSTCLVLVLKATPCTSSWHARPCEKLPPVAVLAPSSAAVCTGKEPSLRLSDFLQSLRSLIYSRSRQARTHAGRLQVSQPGAGASRGLANSKHILERVKCSQRTGRQEGTRDELWDAGIPVSPGSGALARTKRCDSAVEVVLGALDPAGLSVLLRQDHELLL